LKWWPFINAITYFYFNYVVRKLLKELAEAENWYKKYIYKEETFLILQSINLLLLIDCVYIICCTITLCYSNGNHNLTYILVLYYIYIRIK